MRARYLFAIGLIVSLVLALAWASGGVWPAAARSQPSVPPVEPFSRPARWTGLFAPNSLQPALQAKEMDALRVGDVHALNSSAGAHTWDTRGDLASGAFRYTEIASDSIRLARHWSANTRANDDAGAAAQNNPTLAVSPDGAVNAAWHDYRNGNWDIYFARSNDGGTTWLSNTNVLTPTTANEQSYPSLAAGSDGALYLAWDDYRSGNFDIYFARSTEGGATWLTNTNIITPSSSVAQSYPSLAVGGGNVYLAWQDYRNGNWDVYFARSTDGGSTWLTNTNVITPASSAEQSHPRLAVDVTGTFYLAWHDWRNGNWDIYFSKSTDGGNTWSANVKVNDDTGGSHSSDPSLAVDGNGVLYLAWEDSRRGNYDIYTARSTDGGATWSANVRVSDDTGAAHQLFPSVAVVPDGTLYVAWQDERNSTNEDIYFAASFDGGKTWTANARVDNDPGTAVQANVALAVGSNNALYATWHDSRSGNADIYTSHFGPLYEMSGTYTADWDAGDIVAWNSLAWTSTLPAGTAITLAVRVGNTPAPDVHWSDWYTFTTSPVNLGDLHPSRYLEWNAWLATPVSTTTPALEDVTLAWNGLTYTPVAGSILTHTTWTAAGSPYLVIGNTMVNPSVTLTLEPGVTVWFSDTRSLDVQGGLIARGTATNPITLTSWHAQGQKDDWGAITFGASAISATFDAAGNYAGGSALQYATVEYAGWGSATDYAVDSPNIAVYVDHSVIRHNGTGGLRVGGSRNSITNNTINDNDGNGLYTTGSPAVITGNVVSYNAGQGIYNTASPATVVSNTISHNTDRGIYNTGTLATITDNTINDNATTGHGGGIFNSGPNATISRNVITGTLNADYGGGIYNAGANALISDNTISGNHANYGGGVLNDAAYVTLSRNAIQNNSAYYQGGGIYNYRASYTVIRDNTISDNVTQHPSYGGGGIFNYSSYVTIDDNVIVRNFAPNYGGGIRNWDGAIATLRSNTIVSNTANGPGGGLYNSGSSVILNSNIITGNQAGGVGGGLWWSGTGEIVYNNVFSNTATGGTGGVYINSDYPTLHYNALQGNSGYALYNNNATGATHLDALYNWWGTTDAMAILGLVYDQADDASKSIVDVSPYLTSGGPSLIAFTKTAFPDAPAASEPVLFTLAFTNQAPGAAASVYLTDALPASMTFVPGSATNGAVYADATRTVSWTGSVAPGEEKTVKFKAAVNPDIAPDTLIANTAWLWGDGAAGPLSSTAVLTVAHIPPARLTLAGPATGLGSTAYAFTATVNGPMAIYEGQDANTQGNWGGAYGGDGYVLVNWNNGSDLEQLPAYVSDISYSNMALSSWSWGTSDPRALPGQADNGGVRKASIGYSGSSFDVNITVTDTAAHELALYVLDWDTTSRQQMIQFLDPSAGSVLATSGTLQDYNGGVYVLFTFRGSVKIRFTRVAGYNAVLSGIFFDTGRPLPLPTLPMTYTWQATGQAPATRILNSLSDVVAFTWNVLQPQVITVTASNAAGLVTDTHTILIGQPPASVTLDGPAEGVVGRPYTFTASVSPLNATQPITYIWQMASNGIDPSAVMWLRLDEPVSATTFVDTSGHGNHGTCSGATCPAAGVRGRTATALQFDGVDDYMSVPDNPSLDLTTFSVGAWVMPAQIKGDWQPLIIKVDSAGRGLNYGLYIYPNEMKALSEFTASDCATYRSLRSADSLVLNQWNHVMMTYDGSRLDFYLNGDLDSSVNIVSSVCQHNEPVTIGRQLSAYPPFAGRMDDIAIYNRALTADEVRALVATSSLERIGGLTDVITFTWGMTGTQWITVTALNPLGAVSDTHSIWLRNAGEQVGPVYDGGAIRTWNSLAWTSTLPAETVLSMTVRVGNTSTPDQHWTDWRTVWSGTGSGQAQGLPLPPGRYLQWRVSTLGMTGDITPNLQVSPTWIPFLYTPIAGDISDLNWRAANSPYFVTGNALVKQGTTLNIEPGVTVWFSDTRVLQVDGTLIARGTATQPITFTSWHAQGQRDDWGMLAFNDTAGDATFDASGNYLGGSALQYATVEYSGLEYTHPTMGRFSYAVDAPKTTLYVDHCTVRYNGSGGVRSVGGRVTYNTVVSNTLTAVADVYGAGISNSGGGVVSYNTVTGNSSAPSSYHYYQSLGGGISSSGGGIVSHNTVMENTSNNFAYANGSGIYSKDGGIVSDNTVAQNSSVNISGNSYGNGIYSAGGGTVSSNTVTGNRSDDVSGQSCGGGIYSVGGGRVSDNTLTGNHAASNGKSWGGGICDDGDGGTVTGNTITGNYSYSHSDTAYGGGIYSDKNTVSRNIVMTNVAYSRYWAYGGGIYSTGAYTISDNTVTGNQAYYTEPASSNRAADGGGIYSVSGGVIVNNVVRSNVVTGALSYAGGVYVSDGALRNNTIVDNASHGDMGGVWWGSGSGDLTYNTLTGNTTPGDTGGIYILAGYPTINHNGISDNSGFALYNHNPVGDKRLDARYNWWGTTDVVTLQSLIYDWADDLTRSLVDYTPYLFSQPNLGPAGVNVIGRTAGMVGVTYRFEASVYPIAAIMPITYTWQATEAGAPIAHEVNSLFDSASFSWNTTGVKLITVTARNLWGAAAITHAVDLAAPSTSDAYEIDDTCAQARNLAADGSTQFHTFHAAADVDWAFFQAAAGTTYVVEATVPDDSDADVNLQIYDTCGGAAQFGQDNAFSPGVSLSFTASKSGPLYLRLAETRPQGAARPGGASYYLSARVLSAAPRPGAVVLVAGKRKADDALQANIYNVTNAVYRLFLANGYTSDRIYYLAPDLNLDVNGDGKADVAQESTKANLRYAITQWAKDRVSAELPFTLYMMDHGAYDLFYLNHLTTTVETVTPHELNGWLSELEAAAPGVKVNVIVEACHSGSFIDVVQTISKPGRVVIGSTGAWPVAYASPTGGAMFSDAFVAGLGRGMSLHSSFAEARWTLQQAHPDQTPWLDDNGNGVPNELADGQEAARRGFAYAGTFADVQWPPYIAQAVVLRTGGTIKAEVQITESKIVSSVWALIYVPLYQPPPPGEDMAQDNVPKVMLTDPNRDGIYTASYNFTEPGVYRVVIYAVDDQGMSARPRESSGGAMWKIYLPLVRRNR